MKLLGRVAPNIKEVPAHEVKAGDVLAGGVFQPFVLSNAERGEVVLRATEEGGLVYIVGDSSPGWAWTLTPEETVMIEKEN